MKKYAFRRDAVSVARRHITWAECNFFTTIGCRKITPHYVDNDEAKIYHGSRREW